VGGVLVGIPSNVAFSLAFIAWNQSIPDAVRATAVIPLSLSFTGAFPLIYAYLAKSREFELSLVLALAIWSVLSFSSAIVISDYLSGNFLVSLVASVPSSLLLFYVLARRQRLVVGGRKILPTTFQFLWRFVLSGGVVVCAVLANEFLGPFVGGVLATFPAVMISTLIIVNHAAGKQAARELAVPMMVSTVMTIIPYAVIVRFSFPILASWLGTTPGIWLGSLAGYAVSLPLAFVAYSVVKRIRESNNFKLKEG